MQNTLVSKSLRAAILTIVVLASVSARSADLTPLQMYRRCYIHMTGETPVLSDTRIAQVKAGTLNPIDACMAILVNADIDPNDATGRLKNPTSPEAVKVMNNFYRLQSMFVKNRGVAVANFNEDMTSTDDVYDNTSVGLAFTEALLNPNRNFSEIFTTPKNPLAVRQLDPSVTYPFSTSVIFGATHGTATDFMYGPRTRFGETYTAGTTYYNPDTIPYAVRDGQHPDKTYNYTVQTFDTIPVGQLIGINYHATARALISIPATPTPRPSATPAPVPTPSSTVQGVKTGFDITSTIFPGMMFSRSYVMANAALSNSNQQKSDLQFMHRRFSQAIVRDFLCRDLPVLRETDIQGFMSSVTGVLPFRQSTSCLRCHSTIDQLAGSFRGLGYIVGGDRDPTILYRFQAHPNYWASTLSASAGEAGSTWTWPPVQDTSFYARPPSGRLFFRSVAGELIMKNLSGPQDLGPALASIDDPYICYARNLFKHFTGLNVPMIDPGDPSQASRVGAMTSKDYQYQSFIIKLGKELHSSNKKPRDIIEEILRSDYYKASDFQAGGT